MSPQEFRERHRDTGTFVRVPADEIEAHLANGWTLVDEELVPDGALMRAPRQSNGSDRSAA